MIKSQSAWQKYKEKNGVTPLDLISLKTKYSDKELSEKRLTICKECPELIKLTKQCKKCGCFMEFKTRLEKAICPMGKW